MPANLPDSPGAALAGRHPADHLDGLVRRLDQRVVVPTGRVHPVGRHRHGARDPRRQGDPRADRDDRRQHHRTGDRTVPDRTQRVHPGNRADATRAPRSMADFVSDAHRASSANIPNPSASTPSTRCRSCVTNASARCHRSRVPVQEAGALSAVDRVAGWDRDRRCHRRAAAAGRRRDHATRSAASSRKRSRSASSRWRS